MSCFLVECRRHYLLARRLPFDHRCRLSFLFLFSTSICNRGNIFNPELLRLVHDIDSRRCQFVLHFESEV